MAASFSHAVAVAEVGAAAAAARLLGPCSSSMNTTARTALPTLAMSSIVGLRQIPLERTTGSAQPAQYSMVSNVDYQLNKHTILQ